MSRQPRLLVAIANHGHKNTEFCRHLIDQYSALAFDTTIVVLSDTAKHYGSDVEVRIGAPTANPWSLPFGHRPLFVEESENYDFFIYTEDDTEILGHHVELFVEATRHLPDDKVLGFIRYEKDDAGTVRYSTVHHSYRWIPDSVTRSGDYAFAEYTNTHAGAYVLTQSQLKRCIASGGYALDPHDENYDMLVSAATDPYTQCGLTKVVCLTELRHNSLHHMPNAYLGKIGVEAEEFECQVEQLLAASADGNDPSATGHLTTQLFDPSTCVPGRDHPWDKVFYEPLRPRLLEAVPGDATSILSVGCERGLNEAALAERGMAVTGIPIDGVIASSAARRGIEVTDADLDRALAQLEGRQFDVVLFNRSLSYFPRPVEVLRGISPLISSSGSVIVGFENMAELGIVRSRLRPAAIQVRREGFEGAGIHWTSPSTVSSWLTDAGYRVGVAIPKVDPSREALSQRMGGRLDSWLARDYVVVASRRDENVAAQSKLEGRSR